MQRSIDNALLSHRYPSAVVLLFFQHIPQSTKLRAMCETLGLIFASYSSNACSDTAPTSISAHVLQQVVNVCCHLEGRWSYIVRADFYEGDEDSNFQFSESGGSLNGPDLFTELPFL